ncbi:unnamed protein product [Rotaria sordida]|uniref:Uncharacterized protein n=1 Tax=Rotaria sordida TaxID=392033 RepID=A0A815CWM0_9BILA|nr:unnamed protein product [Rotaria sordida]
MNQIESITTDNNVFNRQQSIYDGSTTHSNFSEALIVVWLRTKSAAININFDSIESKIENSVDLLKNFHDLPKECEQYICSRPKNIKILFILSHEYAQALLESVHDQPVLHSIYIYVNTYTDLNILTNDLCSEIYNYIRHVQLPMTIFKQQYEQDQSTNLLNKFAYFIDFWNPLFIDLLFDLPQTDYEQQMIKFLEQCRIYYRANESVLQIIDKFENEYKPEFAIRWYLIDSFIFRLLNKAVRQQNIEGILILRFFIFDLFNELNKIYHEFIDSNVYEDNTYEIVYRGQKMFIHEIDKLKKNLNYGPIIISINSFFSASRTQGIALRFSGAIETDNVTSIFMEDMKPVLFEIEIKIDHKM